MSVKIENQDSVTNTVESTPGSAPGTSVAATANDQPAAATSQAQPAAATNGPAATSFEDFDLDDVEVVESKVFA